MPARRATEQRHELRLGELGDLTHGREPPLVQLSGRRRPNTPQTFNRERMKERQLAVGWHEQETVGLGHAACHLGEELRPRNPDSDGETDPLEHVAPQPGRDLDRRARDALQPANVEKRLIDREALHEWCRVVEHAEHGPARLGIGGHARGDDDGFRTQPAGIAVRTPEALAS